MNRENLQNKWYPTRPNGHSDIVMVQQDRVKWMPAQLPAGVDLHLSDFARALQMLGLNKEAVVELVGRKKKESDRSIPNMQPGAGEVGSVAISALRDDLDDELEPEGVVERDYLYQIFVDKVAIEHQVNGLSGEQMLDEIARLVDEQIKRGLVQIKKESLQKELITNITDMITLSVNVLQLALVISYLVLPNKMKDGSSFSTNLGVYLFFCFYYAKLTPNKRSKEKIFHFREWNVSFWQAIALRLPNIIHLYDFTRDYINVQRMRSSMSFSRRHRE